MSNHSAGNNNEAWEPVVPANETLPEITLKVIILSVILVILLCAANAYLGLKVGITVSASIPAAIISMGVLRFFRNHNILENNMVQTAASAGEGLVGGVAFILPALIVIHFWFGFHYWETAFLALIGGLFGLFFSIPIRRVLLPHKHLRFPEGTAIGQVLKAGAGNAAGLHYLVKGGVVGGLISLCQGGFQIITNEIDLWARWGNSFVYGCGVGLDPAILAAGYIVGINVSICVLVGVIIGWVMGIPILSHIYGISDGNSTAAAMTIWHDHVRYIGVGTMLVGGFWTLLTLAKPILAGLRSSFASVKNLRSATPTAVPRTDRDLPIHYAGWCMLLMFIPLAFLLFHFTNGSTLQLGHGLQIATVVVGILFIVVVGFIFSALAGYFAGLVGSTNSPGSSLTLSALLLISLMLLALYEGQIHFATNPQQMLSAAAIAIIIATVVAAANIITNETIQDLKAGQIVGATPWKQQAMMVLGVIVAAFLTPLVLQLLFNAYGIAGVFPHAGMDPNQVLAAPQANVMAAIAQGVFSHKLPWLMLSIGGIIAVLAITTDYLLRAKGKSFPVLALGFGIYLPLSASTPFVVGGIISFIAERLLHKQHPLSNEADKAAVLHGRQRGLILACGIVSGAALMGVILAIPFALEQSSDALKLVPNSFAPIATVLGALVALSLLTWICRVVVKGKS
jgi:putative OPT family oligopeptide transporter